jgi:squalene-associated FAD-dependent desaturase
MSSQNTPTAAIDQPANPNQDHYDVAIIGGGLAGIAAAFGLSRNGFRVVLLESKRQLGGRAGSFTDSSSQHTVDYCQHVGMHCCTNLRRLIDYLDQKDDWNIERELRFVTALEKPSDTTHDSRKPEAAAGEPAQPSQLVAKASWLPAPLHLAGLLNRWPRLTLGDRINIAIGMWRLFRLRRDSPAACMTAQAWLRSAGQTDRSIRLFWTTILVSALGETIGNVSINAARKVIVDGFAQTRNAFWLWVPRRPLSQLFGVDAKTSLETAGVDVQLGCRIQDVTPQLGGDQSNLLNGWNLEVSGKKISASQLVVATAWYHAKPILQTAADHLQSQLRGNIESIRNTANATDELGTSPITGIHTWWDRRWLQQPNAILVDRFCHWVFAEPLHNTSSRDEEEHYVQIVISGSHDLQGMSSSQVEEKVIEDLRGVFPACHDATLLRSKIVTDPKSVYSLSAHANAMRPSCDALSHSRIWMAGDWVQTGWPATMEGAIRSGFDVADRLGAEGLENTQNRTQETHLADDLKPGWLARFIIHQEPT